MAVTCVYALDSNAISSSARKMVIAGITHIKWNKATNTNHFFWRLHPSVHSTSNCYELVKLWLKEIYVFRLFSCQYDALPPVGILQGPFKWSWKNYIKWFKNRHSTLTLISNVVPTTFYTHPQGQKSFLAAVPTSCALPPLLQMIYSAFHKQHPLGAKRDENSWMPNLVNMVDRVTHSVVCLKRGP